MSGVSWISCRTGLCRLLFWISKRKTPHDELFLTSSASGRFRTWLATERKVAAATQNQALAALLFLCKAVLGVEIDWMDDIVRARRPVRVPVVLTKDEVCAVLSKMTGANKLRAVLLYGTGMRVSTASPARKKPAARASQGGL
jgi:site-specific recombinase XerD